MTGSSGGVMRALGLETALAYGRAAARANIQSTSSGLFPPRQRKILIERGRLFTDPVAATTRNCRRRPEMKALNAIGIVAILMVGAGAARAQNAPPVSTKKVDGTDNVYVFRYGGHQTMFGMTPHGVNAPHPASSPRPPKPSIDPIKAPPHHPAQYPASNH